MTKADTRLKVYDALTGDRLTTSEVAERAGLGLRTVQEHLRELVCDQTTEVFPGDDGTNPNHRTYYRRDRQTMAQRMSARPQDIHPKPEPVLPPLATEVMTVSPEGAPTFTPVDGPKDPPAPPESPSPQSDGTGVGPGQPMRASLGLDPEFLPEARDDEFEGDPTLVPVEAEPADDAGDPIPATFGDYTNPK